MKTPKTRSEFEHNLFLVYENMSRTFARGDHEGMGSAAFFTLPHLEKVKSLPNKRIDLITIDESLRLQANTLNMMQFLPPVTIEKDEDHNGK